MRQCLSCCANYDSSLSNCPECHKEPIVLDGFQAFAPELAYASDGFKSVYFAGLAALEANNFWFRARNKLIIWALNAYVPKLTSFFEIGCGTGFVLSGIAKAYPAVRLMGSEIFTAGLREAAKRLQYVTLAQMDARTIPYQDEFDAIGAFDMLEHIREDEQVLSQIHKALKPHGTVLISVPQHPWLWSAADDFACHVRRYTRDEIHQKIKNAGFSIVRSTSFMALLLPCMIISRMLSKKVPIEAYDPSAELKLTPFINTLFLWILSLELVLIKIGVNFEFGGSRLVVAKKI